MLSEAHVRCCQYHYFAENMRQYHELIVGIFPVQIWGQSNVPERWQTTEQAGIRPYGVHLPSDTTGITHEVPLQALERLFPIAIEKEMLLDGFNKTLEKLELRAAALACELERLCSSPVSSHDPGDAISHILEIAAVKQRLLEIPGKKEIPEEEKKRVEKIPGNHVEGFVVRVATHAVDKEYLRRKMVFRLRSVPMSVTDWMV